MENINRIKIIQSILAKKKSNHTYLEIGVARGDCFLKIRAKRKIGIDPYYRIAKRKTLKYKITDFLYWHRTNLFNITSDNFFINHSNIFNMNKIDVAFIDGLHSYEQSLIDVHNCLKYLNDDGVILIHDCHPLSDASAHPAKSLEHAESMNLPGWTGQWCGDVWKTIVNLRAIESNLKIYVLDCDYGMGVVYKGIPEKMLSYSDTEIDEMSFSELESKKAEILNIKPPDYLFKILKEL